MMYRMVTEALSLFGPLLATCIVLGVYFAREIRREGRKSTPAFERRHRPAA